jgi:hypothetical protein
MAAARSPPASEPTNMKFLRPSPHTRSSSAKQPVGYRTAKVTFVSLKHVAGILPAVASLFGRSSRATLCQVGPESRVNHVESSREKPLDRHGALDKILRELSTVTGILWIPHLDATARPPAQAASRTAVRWQEAIARGSLATAPPPADHPLWRRPSSALSERPPAPRSSHTD